MITAIQTNKPRSTLFQPWFNSYICFAMLAYLFKIPQSLIFVGRGKYQFWQKLATAILLFVFVFNFASINFVLVAQAQSAGTANAQMVLTSSTKQTGGIVSNIVFWGLNLILTAVLFLTARFLDLAGMFFDLAFGYNFDGFLQNRTMIEVGWGLSRDVANMFFILILLIIAISTILQFQRYGAKALLAKLIIIALVINFSLMGGYMIIDFANLLSKGFYDALVPTPRSSISGSLMSGTALSQVFNLKETSANGSSATNYVLGGTLAGMAAGCGVGAAIGAAGAGVGAIPGCVVGALTKGAIGGGLLAGVLAWFKWGSEQSFANGANYFSVVMMSNILVFPLLFVFIFGGILLIIRFVVLFFLLVLAPIAYLSYILPYTEGAIWNKWWSEFLCQCFFLPAFMFLLYMAVLFTNTWARFTFNGAVQANGAFLFNTIIICAFMISALVISKKMGCYGGAAVMTMATKGKTMLAGYTGALALRNTTGRIGEALGRQEWVKGNYYASRAAKGMAGYSGKGIFAKPGKSRSEITARRAEFDVAATRSKAASKQPGEFMAYTNMASKEKYVEDTLKDSKALDEFMKNSNDNAKGEFVRIARLKGGAGAEKAFNDAKRRNALRGLKGDDLAKHFNRADQTNDGRAEDLKAMEAGQIADLLDTQSGYEQKLKTITNTVASKFEPEKQEKFYRAAMTGSSVDTAEKVYKHVPEQIRREFALRNTERTDAIFNKMKQSGNADADMVIDDIKKSGAEERYTRAGNPNRKNWMRRLGKHAELAEVEKEEREVKEAREAQKEFNKTQAEVNRRALAQNKGGGASGTSSGGGVAGGGGSTLSTGLASPSATLPTDISSPSVKAGYSFKNDFEGKGDAEYAIEQSERQINKKTDAAENKRLRDSVSERRVARGLTPVDNDWSDSEVKSAAEAFKRTDEQKKEENK